MQSIYELDTEAKGSTGFRILKTLIKILKGMPEGSIVSEVF